MRKVLVVSNEKGGTGKTTTSVNLAAVFHGFGNRVLLIDSDPQMNATSSLGCNGRNENNYADLLNGVKYVRECILHTEYCDLIPASARLDLAKKNPDDFIHLQEMIEDKNIESEVRYIDLCPSLGWKPVPARTMNREEKEIPGIRKMPAYDPDAEIRSLSFTVPMWTNAIKRLCGSDSNHASLNAKNMLFESLDELIKHSQELQDQLTRGYMNGQ